MPAGLADAFDGDFSSIHLWQCGEFGDGAVEILDRLAVLERVADVATVQRVLVGCL